MEDRSEMSSAVTTPEKRERLEISRVRKQKNSTIYMCISSSNTFMNNLNILKI
jgi:hypothetical protein